MWTDMLSAGKTTPGKRYRIQSSNTKLPVISMLKKKKKVFQEVGI